MMNIVGPSQSGKTYWLYKLIKFLERVVVPMPNSIVYLHGTEYQDIFNEMKKRVGEKKKEGKKIEINFVECTKTIPGVREIVERYGENVMLILDDLMFVASGDKENLNRLNEYAMKDCHHQNISLIFVCQDMMYCNEKFRQLRSNSLYQVIFNNIGDSRNLFSVFFNRKFPKSYFTQLIKEVYKNTYDYLVFDNDPKNFENTRIRTGIFPDEQCIIFN